MGIYSLNENNNYLADVQTVEIYQEDYMEAALNNVYEATVNMNNIMQAIGIQELAVYESTGQEVVYEAGGTGILAKIKEAIKKIWEKIKSLFTKFFAKLQSYGKDDKAFVNKYKKAILKGSPKKLEVKGFKYNIDFASASDANNKMAIEKTDCAKDGDYYSKDDTEIGDILRGKAIGVTSDLTTTEFNKELFEGFRSGEDKKETIEIGSDLQVGTIIQFLMNTSTNGKTIHKDYTDLERIVNGDIKDLNNEEKKLLSLKDDDGNPKGSDAINENTEKLNASAKYGRALYTKLAILETIDGARMKAFNEKRAFYKSICVKLIGRKEPKNESYEYEEDFYTTENADLNNILGGIKLI